MARQTAFQGRQCIVRRPASPETIFATNDKPANEMKRSIPLLLAVCLLLAVQVKAQMPHIPGDVLVQVEHGYDVEGIAKDLAQVNGVSTDIKVAELVSLPMRIWRLSFDSGSLSQDEMLRSVKGHRAARMAQNNHVLENRVTMPNDPNIGNQWHHVNGNDADIDSDLAWDITTGGYTAHGDTIVVCVVESADTPHPDLQENAWFNTHEIPNNGIDDDNNGYTDDYEGWNPGGNNDNVYGGSHGTQVAGMIGATGDNNLGVAGANWTVKIMVVTVGSLTDANVIASYTYPWTMRRLYNQTDGDRGAFVVSTNASWGIDGGDPDDAPLWCAVYDSLGTDGILSCGATSNSAVNVDQVGDLPTACASEFMVSVTATNNNDQRTFSGYGATTIDVGAPGENVYTTSLGGGYGSTSGTSFASPLTAGVIGLLYSAPCADLMNLVKSDPQEGARYIRDALFNGVDVGGNLPGQTVTGGRINSNNSLLEIMNNCGACPAPYDMVAEAISQTEGEFTWTSLGNGPFNIRYREVGTTTWETADGITAFEYTATGLGSCKEYEFQIESLCDTVSSGFSASVIMPVPVEPTPSITASGNETFCAGDELTLTSSADVSTWSTGETTESIVVNTSGVYFVTANGICSGANSAEIEVTVVDVALPVTSDVPLTGPGVATLDATGDFINWYDDANGSNLVGTGNSWDTPFLNTGTSYWCSNVVTTGDPAFQAANPARSNSGAYHTNGDFWTVFDANELFTIKSVLVYANGAGNRTIGLVDMGNNNTVVQGTFNIPDGESRVQLDFEVPGAGEYGLRIMNGDPQLWRDGNGSNPAYPFSLGSYGELTGATTTDPGAYYYFFYDWEIQGPSITCESDLVEVVISMPVGINENGEGQVNVYPSPASSLVNFDLSALTDMNDVVVLVNDASGKLVQQFQVNNALHQMDVANLAEGLYSFSILQNGAVKSTGRFSVMR